MKSAPFLIAAALLALVEGGTALAQVAPPPATETDWGRMRRDVDAEARRPNGDFEARREAIRERARARFKEADSNGDRQLSREEMTRLRPGMAQHFDRIDSNGDGLASEQELGDAIRKRMQMRRENMRPPPGGDAPPP
ncbi:EF-hand domain-containing protein [Thiobacillus sp.]|uniref:EF-hand domain-containing protein n=1 Tax=Thiobacillus sp. TaxID=924 RepID=UPI0025FA43D8|nr:EF-hand domain-containing protein [Thiobacillus sp.]MBT9539486.1 hypothetical protein [Thiobacillus sp.]